MSRAEIAPQRTIRGGSEVGKEWERDVTFSEVDVIDLLQHSSGTHLFPLTILGGENCSD